MMMACRKPTDDHAGHAGHARPARDAPCEKVGLTGGAKDCLLFADCGHAHFQIDCTRADGTCSCPRTEKGVSRRVPYRETFCVLPDGGAPSDGLRSMLAAARRECDW
jgi:hypothetical protein